MRKIVTLSMVVLIAGLAAAGSITGRVTDEQTGAAISGAMVTAYGANGQSGTGESNERGVYEIPNLSPGTYRVLAAARGYESEHYPEAVEVPRAGNAEGIDFALAPEGGGTGGITGRITVERTGAAIAGAVVTAYGENGQAGTGESNERGVYLISGLAAGTYRVHAAARGYEAEGYPNGVEVPRSGNAEGIDFALTPASGEEHGGITGRVMVARSGTPIAGAMVAVIMGRFEERTTTNERGVYLFRDLEPGRYEVNAAARGFEPAVYPEPVVVVAGEVTEETNFHLVPTAEDGAISGFVYEARTREPIAGVLVIAKHGNERGEALTARDGSYLITGLAAGSYKVKASKRGYETKVYHDRVVVRPGETTPDINLHLRPNRGQTD